MHTHKYTHAHTNTHTLAYLTYICICTCRSVVSLDKRHTFKITLGTHTYLCSFLCKYIKRDTKIKSIDSTKLHQGGSLLLLKGALYCIDKTTWILKGFLSPYEEESWGHMTVQVGTIRTSADYTVVQPEQTFCIPAMNERLTMTIKEHKQKQEPD